MKVLNYNNRNAEELAKEMMACKAELFGAECKDMGLIERAKFILERWFKNNPNANREPEKRKVLKHLYTALAYMGDSGAALRMEMLCNYDAEFAKESGDVEALNAAQEEMSFWQTVLFFISNEQGDSIHLAYTLLYGIGCEVDVERARSIYEKLIFARYDTLDEEKRARLRDARDGKFTCPMSESRKGAIDALLNGDHEQFSKVFNEAMEKGQEIAFFIYYPPYTSVIFRDNRDDSLSIFARGIRVRYWH